MIYFFFRQMEEGYFTNDEDAILLDMAKSFNVKNIKNRLELSAVWDSVTEAYNKATGRNYAKKQLQKRLTNITYKQKKQEEKQKDEKNEEKIGWSSEPKNCLVDLEQQKIRAEMAKEMAELKRAKAEEVRLKKEEVLLKVALANLKEAEKRAELIQLEIEEKKRSM